MKARAYALALAVALAVAGAVIQLAQLAPAGRSAVLDAAAHLLACGAVITLATVLAPIPRGARRPHHPNQ